MLIRQFATSKRQTQKDSHQLPWPKHRPSLTPGVPIALFLLEHSSDLSSLIPPTQDEGPWRQRCGLRGEVEGEGKARHVPRAGSQGAKEGRRQGSVGRVGRGRAEGWGEDMGLDMWPLSIF